MSLYGKTLSGAYRNMRVKDDVMTYNKARMGYFNSFEIKSLLMQDTDCLDLGLGKKFCNFDNTFVLITGRGPCF